MKYPTHPPYLKEGDTVAIVCPAGNISGGVQDAVDLLTSWGLMVRLGQTVDAAFYQFAGDDALRARDFQRMLDDDSVKAIFAARGGYGTVRIIDLIDFSGFEKHPKWIIGFSDITVLHSHIQALWGIPTIHGQMPMTIPDATKTSLLTLRDALFGKALYYRYSSRFENRNGAAQGTLIGGNLAILASITGSISEPDYRGKILFLEDVGEYYYSIDRMMWMLKRAGRLQHLRGLIVGGFTALKDNKTPFGSSAQEIILDQVREYDFPVATDFPAGHIDNNKTLIFGTEIYLQVQEKNVQLTF